MFIRETCNCCTGCWEQAVLCVRRAQVIATLTELKCSISEMAGTRAANQSIILYHTEFFWRWPVDALWGFFVCIKQEKVVEYSKVEFIHFLRYDYCIISFEAETIYRAALADTVQRTSSARLFPHSQLHGSAATKPFTWHLRSHLYTLCTHILTIMQII